MSDLEDIYPWFDYSPETDAQPNRPDQPICPIAADGIYPHCVWCNGENYGPAVIDYSKGKIPCASTNNCGKYLPKEYVKLANIRKLKARYKEAVKE